MLDVHDRFSRVVFDDVVDVIMSNTLATANARRAALRRLAEVTPRGSTDLFSGWMTGATQLMSALSPDSVNRVLLLTDGQTNAGVTEPTALATAAADLRQGDIATTTFVVGDDFDERLLRDLAHQGGGQSYYIAEPTQIAEMLTSELGAALEVVRRNAALQVVLSPGSEVELLNRYRSTLAIGDHELRVELGDITSGQELEFVLRLVFPEDRKGATTRVQVLFAGDDAVASHVSCALDWTYADDDANDTQTRVVSVDRAAAGLYAARARAETTGANRAGDFRSARRVLEATARRIRAYADGDRELEALWRALMADVEALGREPMSAIETKRAF